MYTHYSKNIANEMARLEIKLSRARDRLQQVWDACGVTNDRVLKASNDLDVLINEYQRLQKRISSGG